MSRKPITASLRMAGLIVALIVTACGTAPAPLVKIAVSLPQGREVGQDMAHAAQLALSEMQGKAGPYNVELVIFSSSDPKGSPVSVDAEVANAKAAIADPSTVAYLGTTTSDQARAVMALLNTAQMTEVAATTTWPGLTKPGFGAGEPGIYYPTGRRHFFRLVPSDEVQGLVATRWVHQLGAKSVYIVSDGSAYSEGLAGIFEANAADESLQVLGHERFDPDKSQPGDINALANKINAAHPDALYYPASPDHVQLMVELRKLNPKLMLFSGDALTSKGIDSDAEALDGMYATNVVLDPRQLDTASPFIKAYQAAYGKVPSPYAMLTYEAMKTVLQAVARADAPTRDSVLASMGKLGDIDGVLGKWHFDANGDTSVTTISGLKLTSGQWKPEAVIH
jgi:branched-chain amino acid transport system substrate-binding protein